MSVLVAYQMLLQVAQALLSANAFSPVDGGSILKRTVSSLRFLLDRIFDECEMMTVCMGPWA